MIIVVDLPNDQRRYVRSDSDFCLTPKRSRALRYLDHGAAQSTVDKILLAVSSLPVRVSIQPTKESP